MFVQKNLISSNGKVSYTRPKKLTIFAKYFILDVFERVLNTPLTFFYVLANLTSCPSYMILKGF